MTKTQEIIEKLQSGISAKDLINQGYKHGLVYKLNKGHKASVINMSISGLDKPITKPMSKPMANPVDDFNVINDPEIIQLKIDIQKAELRRKLAETVAPIELEPRIADIEKKLTDLDKEIECQFESLIDIQTFFNSPPLSDLLKKHKCSCGANKLLAIKVQCTTCSKEFYVK